MGLFYVGACRRTFAPAPCMHLFKGCRVLRFGGSYLAGINFAPTLLVCSVRQTFALFNAVVIFSVSFVSPFSALCWYVAVPGLADVVACILQPITGFDY